MVSDTAPPPLVTLHKRGAIGLNRTAADVLLAGRKESIKVTLAWDQPGMRLTISAADGGDARTHVLLVYRRHRASAMYLIIAERFFKSSKRLRVRIARRFMGTGGGRDPGREPGGTEHAGDSSGIDPLTVRAPMMRSGPWVQILGGKL